MPRSSASRAILGVTTVLPPAHRSWQEKHSCPLYPVGRGDMHGQQRALAVDRHVARATLDLFAAVKATCLAFGRRFDALATEGGVAGCPPTPAQLSLASARVQDQNGLLSHPALLPTLPVVMHGAVGQSAPAAYFAQPVEDGFDHPALGTLLPRSTRVGPHKERGDLLPVRVAQITRIAHARSLPDG